jgi:hypothetical protein
MGKWQPNRVLAKTDILESLSRLPPYAEEDKLDDLELDVPKCRVKLHSYVGHADRVVVEIQAPEVGKATSQRMRVLRGAAVKGLWLEATQSTVDYLRQAVWEQVGDSNPRKRQMDADGNPRTRCGRK